jgi:hypothetical protein
MIRLLFIFILVIFALFLMGKLTPGGESIVRGAWDFVTGIRITTEN